MNNNFFQLNTEGKRIDFNYFKNKLSKKELLEKPEIQQFIKLFDLDNNGTVDMQNTKGDYELVFLWNIIKKFAGRDSILDLNEFKQLLEEKNVATDNIQGMYEAIKVLFNADSNYDLYDDIFNSEIESLQSLSEDDQYALFLSEQNQLRQNGTTLQIFNGVAVGEITRKDGKPVKIIKQTEKGDEITTFEYKSNNDGVDYIVVKTTSPDGLTVTEKTVLDVDSNGETFNLINLTTKKYNKSGKVVEERFVTTEFTKIGEQTYALVKETIKTNGRVESNLYNAIDITDMVANGAHKLNQMVKVGGKKYTTQYDGNGNTYVVMQNGESIPVICSKYNTNSSALNRLNKGNKDFSNVLVGTVFLVPGEYDGDSRQLKNNRSSAEEIGEYSTMMYERALKELQAGNVLFSQSANTKSFTTGYALAEHYFVQTYGRKPVGDELNNFYRLIDISNGGNINLKAGAKIILPDFYDKNAVRDMASLGITLSPETAGLVNYYAALKVDQKENFRNSYKILQDAGVQFSPATEKFYKDFATYGKGAQQDILATLKDAQNFNNTLGHEYNGNFSRQFNCGYDAERYRKVVNLTCQIYNSGKTIKIDGYEMSLEEYLVGCKGYNLLGDAGCLKFYQNLIMLPDETLQDIDFKKLTTYSSVQGQVYDAKRLEILGTDFYRQTGISIFTKEDLYNIEQVNKEKERLEQRYGTTYDSRVFAMQTVFSEYEYALGLYSEDRANHSLGRMVNEGICYTWDAATYLLSLGYYDADMATGNRRAELTEEYYNAMREFQSAINNPKKFKEVYKKYTGVEYDEGAFQRLRTSVSEITNLHAQKQNILLNTNLSVEEKNRQLQDINQQIEQKSKTYQASVANFNGGASIGLQDNFNLRNNIGMATDITIMCLTFGESSVVQAGSKGTQWLMRHGVKEIFARGITSSTTFVTYDAVVGGFEMLSTSMERDLTMGDWNNYTHRLMHSAAFGAVAGTALPKALQTRWISNLGTKGQAFDRFASNMLNKVGLTELVPNATKTATKLMSRANGVSGTEFMSTIMSSQGKTMLGKAADFLTELGVFIGFDISYTTVETVIAEFCNKDGSFKSEADEKSFWEKLLGIPYEQLKALGSFKGIQSALQFFMGGKIARQIQTQQHYSEKFPSLNEISFQKTIIEGTEVYIVKTKDGSSQILRSPQEAFDYCQKLMQGELVSNAADLKTELSRNMFGLAPDAKIDIKVLDSKYVELKKNLSADKVKELDAAYEFLTGKKPPVEEVIQDAEPDVYVAEIITQNDHLPKSISECREINSMLNDLNLEPAMRKNIEDAYIEMRSGEQYFSSPLEILFKINEQYKFFGSPKEIMNLIDPCFEMNYSKITDPKIKEHIEKYLGKSDFDLRDAVEVHKVVTMINELTGGSVGFRNIDGSNSILRENMVSMSDFYGENWKNRSDYNSLANVEENISTLRNYLRTGGRTTDIELGKYVYENYYFKALEKQGISPEVIAKCKELSKKYNTMIILPGGNSPKGKLELIETELSLWHQAGGKIPRVLDFDAIDRFYNNSTQAYGQNYAAGYSSYDVIGFGISLEQAGLRHELVHYNDRVASGLQEIPAEYNLNVCFPKTTKVINGEITSVPDMAKVNQEWVAELKKAGLSDADIEYAFNSTRELIAKASEGDMSQYSPAFRKVLKDFGMPDYVYKLGELTPKIENPLSDEATWYADGTNFRGSITTNKIPEKTVKSFEEQIENARTRDELFEIADNLEDFPLCQERQLLATKIGEKIESLENAQPSSPPTSAVTEEVPAFSYEKLPDVNTDLSEALSGVNRRGKKYDLIAGTNGERIVKTYNGKNKFTYELFDAQGNSKGKLTDVEAEQRIAGYGENASVMQFDFSNMPTGGTLNMGLNLEQAWQTIKGVFTGTDAKITLNGKPVKELPKVGKDLGIENVYALDTNNLPTLTLAQGVRVNLNSPEVIRKLSTLKVGESFTIGRGAAQSALIGKELLKITRMSNGAFVVEIKGINQFKVSGYNSTDNAFPFSIQDGISAGAPKTPTDPMRAATYSKFDKNSPIVVLDNSVTTLTKNCQYELNINNLPNLRLISGKIIDLNNPKVKNKLINMKDGDFLIIGRNGDIEITGATVSEHHILIAKHNGSYQIMDVSRNGNTTVLDMHQRNIRGFATDKYIKTQAAIEFPQNGILDRSAQYYLDIENLPKLKLNDGTIIDLNSLKIRSLFCSLEEGTFLTLGRNGHADYGVSSNSKISKHHIIITKQNGQFILKDISTNGGTQCTFGEFSNPRSPYENNRPNSNPSKNEPSMTPQQKQARIKELEIDINTATVAQTIKNEYSDILSPDYIFKDGDNPSLLRKKLMKMTMVAHPDKYAADAPINNEIQYLVNDLTELLNNPAPNANQVNNKLYELKTLIDNMIQNLPAKQVELNSLKSNM